MEEAGQKLKKNSFDLKEFIYKYGTFLTIIILVVFFSIASSSFFT